MDKNYFGIIHKIIINLQRVNKAKKVCVVLTSVRLLTYETSSITYAFSSVGNVLWHAVVPNVPYSRWT